MPKSTTTQPHLSAIIQALLTNIKNQKSFQTNIKENIKLFNSKRIHELDPDEKKALFDIFNEKIKDSLQLEKIATWLIGKMGGKFQFHHHYKFDKTFITVKKLTRNFVRILEKTKKSSIAQEYERLCNSRENKLTEDNAYHYLILTGLSLYVFQNKDLIIKQEQDRLNKENECLENINKDPSPKTEPSIFLEFYDSEWKKIELGNTNPLKSSLSANEASKTQPSIDDSKSVEDSADLECNDTKLDLATPTETPVSQHKISGHSKQENKYTFFPLASVAKSKSPPVEPLQQSAPATMLK